MDWNYAQLVCVAPERLALPPAEGEIIVRQGARAHVALGHQVLAHGPLCLPHGEGPLRRVLLPPSPTLDDLLAACLCAAAGEAPPRGLELLCDYAAQLREGLLPGSLPVERSLGGMYLAMLELYREQPEVLLLRGGLLLGSAAQALAAGGSLLHDDLFTGDDRFAREEAYLAADRQRYARDRDTGTCLAVRLSHLPGHLLCLRQPTSILFRAFAYRDEAAPGGQGFDLVLVLRPAPEAGRTHVALFADPTRRLPLREVLVRLCGDLDASEARAAGGQADEPWYDGHRHAYQRLASPRPGTRLGPAEVSALLARALGARAVPAGARGGRARAALLFTAGPALAAALFLCWPRAGPPPEVVVRGDWQQHRLPDGPLAGEGERQGLLHGPIRNYALLVAAGAYLPRSHGGLGPLRTPWRDACALRALLTSRFGYRPGDVITLSDSPCQRGAAGPPTRQQILWTIEHLPIKPDDTLLFYYAGHGAIEDEPGGRYGYLQPGGWEQQGLSREDRGLRMRVLAELLRDKVAARHQLLLIDACHSGETAVVRGGAQELDRLESPVRAGWRERPVYAVITAAGSADLALEERLIDSPHPHSLFMRALMEGLSYAPGPQAPDGGRAACRLRADEDPAGHPDGLITDGELFKYVARRVPELRAAIDVPGLPDAEQRQVPEWNPWAAAPRSARKDLRIGQFLLIPRPRPQPEACPTGDDQGQGDPDPEPEACRPAACAD